MPHLARLKAQRERATLTQVELAAASGVAESTIRALENTAAKARPSTVRKLAQALNVTPADLIGPPTEPPAAAPEPPTLGPSPDDEPTLSPPPGDEPTLVEMARRVLADYERRQRERGQAPENQA